MSERVSKRLQEAQANQTEAERVLSITAPNFARRLLEITDGDIELAKDLMADVANIAGNVATLALADRRVEAIENTQFIFKTKLHPDNLDARQDSLLGWVDANNKLERFVKPVFEEKKK